MDNDGLINSYIYEVVSRLPKKSQQEVERELLSNISDTMGTDYCTILFGVIAFWLLCETVKALHLALRHDR